MPPVPFSPWIVPPTEQPEISPLSVFRPAMPPTAVSPFTVPVKEQFRIAPLLTPAMPPTVEWLPPGATVPATWSSWTTAPFCR